MKMITSLIDRRSSGITLGGEYQLLHTDPRGQITVVDDMYEAHTLQVGMYSLHKDRDEVAPEGASNLESRIAELERLMRDLVVIPFERQPVVSYGGLAR